MAKDPSPRADMLRAQREARYGHLQAKAEQFKVGKWVMVAGIDIQAPVKPAKKAKPKKGKKR